MARGKKLSDIEKGKILALHGEGKKNREIARKIQRSRCLVDNFLKNPNVYGTKKSTGPKEKLTARDKRQIIRKASNSEKSCNEIKREVQLNVSRWTIRRYLIKSKVIKRVKMKRAPFLTDRHKLLRLQFAQQNMNRNWHWVSCFCRGVGVQKKLRLYSPMKRSLISMVRMVLSITGTI